LPPSASLQIHQLSFPRTGTRSVLFILPLSPGGITGNITGNTTQTFRLPFAKYELDRGGQDAPSLRNGLGTRLKPPRVGVSKSPFPNRQAPPLRESHG